MKSLPYKKDSITIVLKNSRRHYPITLTKSSKATKPLADTSKKTQIWRQTLKINLMSVLSWAKDWMLRNGERVTSRRSQSKRIKVSMSWEMQWIWSKRTWILRSETIIIFGKRSYSWRDRLNLKKSHLPYKTGRLRNFSWLWSSFSSSWRDSRSKQKNLVRNLKDNSNENKSTYQSLRK